MTQHSQKQSTTSPRGKILLVEDSPLYSEIFKKLLEELGFEVIHVDCCNHAICKLNQTVEGSMVFDCIILDYDLSKSGSFPDGPNGSDIMRRLQPQDLNALGLDVAPPIIANSGDDFGNEDLKRLGAEYIGAKDINKIKIALDQIFGE